MEKGEKGKQKKKTKSAASRHVGLHSISYLHFFGHPSRGEKQTITVSDVERRRFHKPHPENYE